MELAEHVQKLRESLGQLPEPTVNPAFIVVSGLPGTGKSYFCRSLAERLPFPILESDALRKVLYPSPNYSPGESNRLFGACHLLIEELLRRGIPLRNLDAGKGNWFHSTRFSEVRTAKDWGKSPSEFDVLAESDKAEMMAYSATVAKMEAYEYRRQRKQARGWT